MFIYIHKYFNIHINYIHLCSLIVWNYNCFWSNINLSFMSLTLMKDTFILLQKQL